MVPKHHQAVDDREININKNLPSGYLLHTVAMENCPFIDNFPSKTSIYKGFYIAMLNNQTVHIFFHGRPFQQVPLLLLLQRPATTPRPAHVLHERRFRVGCVGGQRGG